MTKFVSAAKANTFFAVGQNATQETEVQNETHRTENQSQHKKLSGKTKHAIVVRRQFGLAAKFFCVFFCRERKFYRLLPFSHSNVSSSK